MNPAERNRKDDCRPPETNAASKSVLEISPKQRFLENAGQNKDQTPSESKLPRKDSSQMTTIKLQQVRLPDSANKRGNRQKPAEKTADEPRKSRVSCITVSGNRTLLDTRHDECRNQNQHSLKAFLRQSGQPGKRRVAPHM